MYATLLRVEALEARDTPALVYALIPANEIFEFDSASPQSVSVMFIPTNMTAGDTLVGIVFSPAGRLFGLATTATANTVRLYTINPFTSAASAVGTPQTIPAGGVIAGATHFGVAFDPLRGQIQVIDDLPSDGNNAGNANNFTVDLMTGAVTVQNDLSFTNALPGSAPEQTIAFSNTGPGASPTTLYGIATGNSPDDLVSNGTAGAPSEMVNQVAPLGVDATNAALTIGPGNAALAALEVGGVTGLYTVPLTNGLGSTGTATLVNTIGPGTARVLALATPPVATAIPALAVSGTTDGKATVYVPDAAGQYGNPMTPTAPFGTTGTAVRTAVADVDGDGIPDTIYVTGPGTPIRFAVVSGADNTTLLIQPTAPFAGSENFTGGGFVAAADLDGDGRAEIIITPDQGGGPRVTIFSFVPFFSNLGSPNTPVVRGNFLGIDDPNFRGGARAAAGDVNRDGVPDLVVAAGFGGGPRVALFDGKTLFGTPTRLVNDFFTFPGTDATNLRNGSFVTVGDVNGDGFGDLIFGSGPGGAPRVFILNGQQIVTGDISGAYSAPVANFFVAGNSADRGGVRVAVKDADGDGKADVAVGSGAGSPGRVRVYLGMNFAGAGEPATFQDIAPFGGAVLADGVYVG